MTVGLLPVPLIANRYRLLEKIGQGGMGAVYRAQDRLRGTMVALKRVELPYNSRYLSETQLDSELASRMALVNEFRLLASLRHPHIVSVLDYGLESDNTPFFTMELIDTPQPFMRAINQYTLVEKVKVLVQLLQALVYLHRHNIVHHDLKPNNVLIDSAGQVRVVDFGLALRAQDHTSQAGTLHYTAPELIEGGIATVATDLYSFGVMCYEALLGERPFQMRSISQLKRDIRKKAVDFQNRRESLGQPITELLTRLLAKDPQERPPNASYVKRTLCAAVGLPPPVETPDIRNSFLQTAQFVGRVNQLTQLEQALDEATEGRGSAWFVVGESGVGKTRLLDELRIRALVKDIHVLRGQVFENTNSTFEMWRAPIEALLLTTPVTPLEASILKALVPTVDDLLEYPVEEIPPLPPLAQQDRLMTTIVELFVRQAQPILLLLDDLQFAHADLDLFNLLTKAISVLPILLVGTYRQEETPQWADQFSTARVIKLGRLSADEIEQLSTAILGEDGSRKILQTLLYRETEGNTFFLIEVLRMLAEDAGQLAQIGSRALPEHVFPVGVANIINRRLNRLSDLDQQVLKFAAVCGRIIDFRLIAHCYPDHQLIYWVTHCADAGILTITDGRPEFAHDKLRSVIISSIEPNLLKCFHLQIAEAIEQLYELEASYASMLAYHFYNAGELERAIPYQLMEAERLIELGELNRARAMLMNFLIEVERQELPQPDECMMRWYFLLGKTLEYGIMMVGNSEEAIGWYERSLMLSMALNEQSMIATTLTRIAYITLQHYGGAQAVEDMLAKAETIFQETNDKLGLASIAITRAAARALETKYAEAATLYQQAMPIFEETNNLSLLALTRERNGVAIGQMGDLDGSREELNRALQLARQIGDRIRVVNILNALSVNAIVANDIETAVEYMDEAYPLAMATEQYRTMASIWINRAELYYYKQQYEQARDALLQSIAISENIGNLRGVAWAYANLAENELFLNNLDGARVALKRWLDIAANMERSALRVGTIPTIRLAVLEHHYALAAEWLGMMLVICTTERDMMALLYALRDTVKAKLGKQAFAQRFERGKTLIIEQEMPRLRTYIEERYPTSHG